MLGSLLLAVAPEFVWYVIVPTFFSVQHVATVKGFVSQFKCRVIPFFLLPLPFSFVLLILGKLGWCVRAWQRVDVRRKSHVKSVALFSHDVTILACIALHLLSSFYAVESIRRTREGSNRRLEIALSATCLAHFMLVHLLFIVKAKFSFIGPQAITASLARLPEVGLGLKQRCRVLLLLVLVQLCTNSDHRGGANEIASFWSHRPPLRSRFWAQNGVHWTAF